MTHPIRPWPQQALYTLRGMLVAILLLPWTAWHATLITFYRIIWVICGRSQRNHGVYAQATERLYDHWVAGQAWCFQHLLRLKLNMVMPKVAADTSHLMIANHQCYADIVILQLLCHRRLPTTKFFLKDALIYLPFIGIGCWGLDFVFVKRFSRQHLKKNPKRLTQLNARIDTQCRGFQQRPLTLINFIEGTRINAYKQQRSTFKHLLVPQAVGLATMIRCLYPQAKTLLDVTIDYGIDRPTFWGMLSGRIQQVHVHVHAHTLSPDLVGHYQSDKGFRRHFRGWLNTLWQQKDARMPLSKTQHSTT